MAEIKIIAVMNKLRPRIKTGRMIELDAIADEIAEQSGFDRGDVRDMAYKIGHSLIQHLQQGDHVKLGEIGNFKPKCDKDKNVSVSYRSSKVITTTLGHHYQGEFINPQNAGLDALGFANLWLTLHPDDTVIMNDGRHLSSADFE